MKALGSVAAVIAAIHEDGAAELETTEIETARAVSRMTAEGAAEAGSAPDTAGTLAAARDSVRTRLAQEDWEDARQALADREAWIARAVELGDKRVRDREDIQVIRERLASLAREGLERMPPGPVEIAVSAEDHAVLDDDWHLALGAAAAHSVQVVTASITGGCVVRAASGRSTFDNTYAARAERLQSAWRGALADIYERATDGITSTAAGTEVRP